MPNVNTQLADQFVGRGVNLARFDAHLRQRVLGYLHDLEGDLVDQLTAMGTKQLENKRRLETLLEQIRSTFADVEADVTGQLTELADVEHRWTTDTVNRTVGMAVFDAALTPQMLQRIVDDTLIEGAPSAEWWGKQSDQLRRDFAQQIRLGMGSGESIDDMVRRIRGTATSTWLDVIDPKTGRAKKVRQFAGGVMETSTQRAAALVRTSVQTVANQARLDTYQANDDVIKGVTWVATLDSRTCLKCGARDGNQWSLDHQPINGSQAFHNAPLHWSCRCTLSPVLKSWRELGFDLDEAPRGTRASMDGQVPSTQTFEEWLGKQSDDTIEDVLGKKRTELYRQGRITLHDLLNQSDRALPLEGLVSPPSAIPSLRSRLATAIAGGNAAIGQFLKDEFGIDTSGGWTFDGWDPQVRQATLEGLVDVAEKFGPIDEVAGLGTVGLPREAYAWYDRANRTIRVSEAMYGLEGTRPFEALAARASESINPSTETFLFGDAHATTLIQHEYGHGVDYLVTNCRLAETKGSRLRLAAERLFQIQEQGSLTPRNVFDDEAMDTFPRAFPWSKYARQNREEAFAELFAARWHVPAAQWTPEMREFYGALDEFIAAWRAR